MFHIFKNGSFTERVTGSTPFHPLVSCLQKRHFHREGYNGSTPFHPLVSHLQKRHFYREGYRLHPFSPSCFISSKTAFSPKRLPAPPLFIRLFHIFKDDIFTERATGSTPFHPLVSFFQKRHFHREGYQLHPFSSSCFISSKTFKNDVFTGRVTSSTPFHPLVSFLRIFSPRQLPAPPLFIHISKNGIFTGRVTGSTPFHPLVSSLQKPFHREGYRLHPFSSFCFRSSTTKFSPRGLPAPPLFILFFHFFKDGIFTERVSGSTPFHPFVSYLQKRRFNREGTGSTPFHPLVSFLERRHLHIFSPTGLPAPPLFILLFHILNSNIFTKRVTGSTPFHPLVSYPQIWHYHREGYRLHPFSSSCFISSQNGSFTERVTGSTPFHPLVSYLQKRKFHREGYRPHPFSSSCFISSNMALSPRGLPAPPLFILLFHIFTKRIFLPRGLPAPPLFILLFHISKNGIFKFFSQRGFPAPALFILLFHIFKDGIFTERVTGSTPFYPLVSYPQKRHFHREGYQLHLFSPLCFISSKTTFSPRGLPAPPLVTLLFHIFKNGTFTERVTGSTPFHPLVSYLQRHFHREGSRLRPFSPSCFISSKTAFSRRGLPAPPLFHREGYQLHSFSSSCFTSSKTTFSPRRLPAPPVFILLFHIFKNGISPRGLPAPPLFILLFHIFKDRVFTDRVTGSTPFHPLVSSLQKPFHREGYRLHPFSSSCFISSKAAFSPRRLPAPTLFILLFHIFKDDIFTKRVTGSTPFHPRKQESCWLGLLRSLVLRRPRHVGVNLVRKLYQMALNIRLKTIRVCMLFRVKKLILGTRMNLRVVHPCLLQSFAAPQESAHSLSWLVANQSESTAISKGTN